ncbi:MAG TPA: TolC family protein, partial [Pyrinomonadaceae bacterium]|nr:TolC family protein [Pyrinomonadaceae bacterium]
MRKKFLSILFLICGSGLVAAQEPSTIQQLPVPPVAPDFRAPQKPLPDLNRVGVDMNQQHPLSLREALSMALANNKDIEVARDNVRIAEFDLVGAQGVYDPRVNFTSFYERVENPISSFLSGGQNGSTITSDYAGTARLEGQSPKLGGNYRLDFSSIRLTTNNEFVALNPQYPTALTFTYTQPLWRGLRIDGNRRHIEIARKNLSLTDAQFRQRAIDTITNVQRAYWDLVFALRSLQVQRDAVTVARTQLEHNKRMVREGQLAPIDIVAAEAQISSYEQGVFSALEEVSRAENNLKNLIAENQRAAIWGQSLVPTDPVDLAVPNVSLPDALQTAMENRPELQQANVVKEINQIDQKFFKDQTKPAIDLV